MVERIIDLSIKARFLLLSIIVALLLVAVQGIKSLALDALPDLSPVQVVLDLEFSGASPKIIEEQLTYPLVSNLMSLKNIETIRAMSSFERGMIYIIFKDGSDIYDAREQIQQRLSTVLPTLPSEAMVTMGSDATGVGWAYQYVLRSTKLDLGELRDYQDFYLKYALLGVDGVSEVASVGGFSQNYQVSLDQDRLRYYGVSVSEVAEALRANNADAGGGAILENGYEQIVQASGYAKGIEDLEQIVIKLNGIVPLKVSDLGSVSVVPDSRRGVVDLDGKGESVAGIVILRYKANTFEVLQRVKDRIASLSNDTVEILPAYDRSLLIQKAIDTLTRTLLEESIIVVVVSLLFLGHFRSSLIMLITLPLTVIFTLFAMSLLGIGSNIMSLGGIAIAIGAMVDATIVMVENAHKHLASSDGSKSREEVIITSAKQVARPIFFALLLVVVSFLPIFALQNQEAQLFHPLAYTKSFAMLIGALLSITLVPILMLFFIRGNIKEELANPLNRALVGIYTPALKLAIKFRYAIVALATISLVLLYPLYNSQKWEFMPTLDEGDVMYMPVTPYGVGIDLAKDLLQHTDAILKSFDEVEMVFGKAGNANTATDPAPLAMLETIITLKPKEQWREGMSKEKLLYEMDRALQVNGLINSWTYPIRGRIDMLLTGIRTPLGIKIYGDDATRLESVASQIERKLKPLKESLSVSADKVSKGYFIDLLIDETSLARYGVSKDEILRTVGYGVGGAKITTHIDSLKRHSISLRLESHQRNSLEALRALLVSTPQGYFPLEHFAHISYKEQSVMIKSEKGMRVAFVYILPRQGVSASEYKKEATKVLATLSLPDGYYYEFAGQSEYLERSMERIAHITPVALLLTLIFIYLALRDFGDALTVFASLSFTALGALYYVDLLGYNLSIAVAVGFLALLGIAAETAIVMMIYLKEAYKSTPNLLKATIDGSAKRLRPKMMTLFAILGSLLPIMYIDGVGSEVMRKIAAPMIGGIAASALLTLFIIPLLFYIKHELLARYKKDDKISL